MGLLKWCTKPGNSLNAGALERGLTVVATFPLTYVLIIGCLEGRTNMNGYRWKMSSPPFVVATPSIFSGRRMGQGWVKVDRIFGSLEVANKEWLIGCINIQMTIVIHRNRMLALCVYPSLYPCQTCMLWHVVDSGSTSKGQHLPKHHAEHISFVFRER